MRASAFLQRARQEGLRYGEDPYVFLRELAQNARDAGATRIDVRYHSNSGQRLVFIDNGDGMSFDHAKAFLFRLYASSKENDAAAAGHFGVGFWSILRWEPSNIRIESRTTDEAWALSIGRDGKAESVPCAPGAPGTTISMERAQPPPVPDDQPRNTKGESTEKLIRRRLHKYCRYLRRANSRQAMAVVFNGQRIDEPMRVRGPVSMHFSSKEAEGVVGLAEVPRVELYARGLWVTEVSFIEELLPEYDGPTTAVHAGGLSPVVILNSEHLDVTLSRQEPVQSRELRRLVALAHERVRRLVGHVADKAFPRPWYYRLGDVWRQAMNYRTPWVLVGWFLFALLNGLLIFNGTRPSMDSSRNRLVELLTPTFSEPVAKSGSYGNISGYRGARVDAPSGDEVPWDLTHDGPDELFFRALTLSHYDRQRGLLKARGEKRRLHPPVRCNDDPRCANVALGIVGARSPLNIPLPTGYAVEPGSLRVDGVPVASSIYSNNWGEAWFQLPPEAELLHYTVVPVKGPAPLARSAEEPDVPLPQSLTAALVPSRRSMSRKRRARKIGAIVESLIEYDIRPQAAAAFSRTSGPWLERVLLFGSGDCDVKNGVNVLALRAAGIPARMAVGIPTQNGRAGRGLHAWTEYFAEGRWWPIDVSGIGGNRLGSGRVRRQPRVSATMDVPLAVEARSVEVPVVSEVVVDDGALEGQDWWRPAAVFLDDATGTDSDADEGLSVTGLLESGLDRTLRLLWATTVYISLMAGMFLLGWALWRRRHRVVEDVAVREGKDVEQQALACILKDALVQPAAWRGAENLWHRPVLPVVEGRPMSIAVALKRAQRGRLWLTRKHSSLARLAARRGTAVLNAAHPVMGDVIAALGRGIDLDSYSALAPTAAPAGALGRLLSLTNDMLRDAGLRTQCYPAPGIEGHAVADVDISDLKLASNSGWPPVFIAVNPTHPDILSRAAAAHDDPAKGAFLFVDWLLDRSELLSSVALPLRRRAAEQLLKSRI